MRRHWGDNVPAFCVGWEGQDPCRQPRNTSQDTEAEQKGHTPSLGQHRVRCPLSTSLEEGTGVKTSAVSWRQLQMEPSCSAAWGSSQMARTSGHWVQQTCRELLRSFCRTELQTHVKPFLVQWARASFCLLQHPWKQGERAGHQHPNSNQRTLRIERKKKKSQILFICRSNTQPKKVFLAPVQSFWSVPTLLLVQPCPDPTACPSMSQPYCLSIHIPTLSFWLRPGNILHSLPGTVINSPAPFLKALRDPQPTSKGIGLLSSPPDVPALFPRTTTPVTCSVSALPPRQMPHLWCV